MISFFQAWEMCHVGDSASNLSYESLTSPETWQVLQDLPISDPDFFAELTRNWDQGPELTEDDAIVEDSEDLDIHHDDSAVPLEAIQDLVHGVLPTDDPEGAFKLGEDGLILAAEAEETLIEEIEGVVIDTTSIREQDLGQGKRKKFCNRHYFWDGWYLDHVAKFNIGICPPEFVMAVYDST